MRLTAKLDNKVYCGFAIGLALRDRQRWMDRAREVRYLRETLWVTEVRQFVRYARKHNHEIVEQLQLLRGSSSDNGPAEHK